MRKIPEKIQTNCSELNEAWTKYGKIITEESQILIADTDETLNFHAFLGHSIDMQGFRAAEFSGADSLSKPANNFTSLKQLGIGIRELGQLWEIETVRNHLLYKTQGTPIQTSYDVLIAEGGENGKKLASAFKNFPFRKGHKYIRALLQNSAKLKGCNYSFRGWLENQCKILGISDFPPSNFRQINSLTGETLEESLCDLLQKDFFMVGPEMAPYMLCDWQLWLWREEKTGVFDTYKLDAFHQDFVTQVNNKYGPIIPADKKQFTGWWYGFYPSLPPRLANECIWLYIEHKLLT
jgi:hypothetical protein